MWQRTPGQPSPGAEVGGPSPGPGTDVAGVSPVPVQMGKGRAQSRRRCGSADVAQWFLTLACCALRAEVGRFRCQPMARRYGCTNGNEAPLRAKEWDTDFGSPAPSPHRVPRLPEVCHYCAPVHNSELAMHWHVQASPSTARYAPRLALARACSNEHGRTALQRDGTARLPREPSHTELPVHHESTVHGLEVEYKFSSDLHS